MKPDELTLEGFQKIEGHCFVCFDTGIPSVEGNSNENPRGSCWELRENGVALRPHAFFPDIVDVGLGRYAHSGAAVYFSSTDNTDPRTNSHRYSTHKVAVAHVQPKRHSLRALFQSLPNVIMERFSIVLNENVNQHAEFDDFWQFYIRSVEKWDQRPNGLLLTTIFLKYCEAKRFSLSKQKWQNPSVEIAVANGFTSVLGINYAFDLGTEVFFNMLEAEADNIPHKNIARFNLNAPTEIGRFKAVVMVHSIDDYSDPDPHQAFKALYDLLEPGGTLYLSGFTDYYCDVIRPYWPQNESFFQYRGLYEGNLFLMKASRKWRRMLVSWWTAMKSLTKDRFSLSCLLWKTTSVNFFMQTNFDVTFRI